MRALLLAGVFVGGVAAAPAVAQSNAGAGAGASFQAGDRVEASPLHMEADWQSCTVVAPVQGGYQINCANGDSIVGARWVRAGGTAPIAPAPAAAANNATGGAFRAGDRVDASPLHMDADWQSCTVVAPVQGGYQVDCANGESVVGARWVRVAGTAPIATAPAAAANNAAGQAQSAAVAVGARTTTAAPATTAPPATTGDVPGGPVRPGEYHCYGGAAGNMELSFLDGSTYANEQGSRGSFTQSGPVITFTSGPWEGFFGYVYAGGDVQLRTAPERPSTMQCDPE